MPPRLRNIRYTTRLELRGIVQNLVENATQPNRGHLLTELTFQNYKAFGSEEQIELRPISVFIGRNSSGKSACCRLPLLLREGLAPESRVPLNLAFRGLDFGGTLVDLIHGRRGHRALTLGLQVKTADIGTESLRIRLQHFDEYKTFQVTDFQIRNGGEPVIHFSWNGTNPISEGSQFRNLLNPGLCTLQFKGLFPAAEGTENDPVHHFLDPIRHRMYSALTPCLYLGPFRQRPLREYRYLGRRPDNVGDHGEGAAQVLAYAKTQQDEVTIRGVSEWFRAHLGAALEVDHGDLFRIVLHQAGTSINLVDVGTGISQVFPLVVQRLAQGGTGPRLEIIEQPELHLHPAAHGDLADLYVNASLESNVQFMIETHSEVFLLRLRRRVAEGKLSPKDVILYWVDDLDGSGSRMKKIEIDSQGDLSHWPSGVFSEDFEEVKAIRKAKP